MIELILTKSLSDNEVCELIRNNINRWSSSIHTTHLTYIDTDVGLKKNNPEGPGLVTPQACKDGVIKCCYFFLLFNHSF